MEALRPVALTAATVDQFLAWASRADTQTRPTVANAIHQAGEDDATLYALGERLEEADPDDVLTSLLVLSVLGELRNPLAADIFEAFVWRPLPKADKVGHVALSRRDLMEMCQSKAVECLAYIGSDDARSRALRVAVDHEARSVRAAAVDALLFNYGESQDDRDRLRELLRSEDAHLVDMTRHSLSVPREEFNARLRAFYQKHQQFSVPAPPGPRPLRQKDTVEELMTDEVELPPREGN